MTTFSMAATTEGVELLIHCEDKCMESTTSHLLHPLVRKSWDPFGPLLEFSASMSTLTLVELWSLTSSPGVEIALRVNGSAMVISTRDLSEEFTLKTFHFWGIVKIRRKIRFIFHVGSSELENLSRVHQNKRQVVAATNLSNFLALKLCDHMKLWENFLLNTL